MLSSTACPDYSGKSRLDGKTFLQTLFFFLFVTQICFAQWYQQNSGTTANLNAVHFENSTNGWVVGDGGIILHTTNAGQDWITQLSGTSNQLQDLFFINEEIGWAVGGQYGSAGSILHTTNGGTSWTSQISGITCSLLGVSFIDDTTGWVVGKDADEDSGIILHTTNGGITWALDEAQMGFWFYKVSFRNVNEGTIIGMYTVTGSYCCCGIIQSTTNGGTTWDTLSAYPGTPRMYGISFIDSRTGWIVGQCEIIYKTTNGGMDWIDQNWGDRYKDLFSVSFTDENTGTAVGGGWGGGETTIYRTVDGGENWVSQASGIPVGKLSGVSLTDANNGWAVGEGGIIIHTTNGGVSFIEDEADHPTAFGLSQNHPNPFNPSTTIKYQIPELSFVTLKVFDVLGNEITTLVNEEKKIGSYEVEFQAINLPSGVYFYQLQAGNYVETKKMVMLK